MSENNTNELIQVSVSGVLDLLSKGKTRAEIAEHYGIPMKEMKAHFKHPDLKGKKTKKAFISVLVTEEEEGKVQEEGIDEITNPISDAFSDEISQEEENADVRAEVASIQEEEQGGNWEN